MLFSVRRSRRAGTLLLHGSIINRFLHEVRDATVQVVPLEARMKDGRMKNEESG